MSAHFAICVARRPQQVQNTEIPPGPWVISAWSKPGTIGRVRLPPIHGRFWMKNLLLGAAVMLALAASRSAGAADIRLEADGQWVGQT